VKVLVVEDEDALAESLLKGLAREGFEVTGLDPVRASIGVARSKPDAERVRWIVGDAPSLPRLELDLATMTGNARRRSPIRRLGHER